MSSVSLFNFQASHYKESLFCFSWLTMRLRYWVECISSLFSCFQMWQSLPADILHSRVWMFKWQVWERPSVFGRASPLLPASFILLYFSSWHLWSHHILFICLSVSPHENVSSLRTETYLVSSAHCPIPAVGKAPGTETVLAEYATSVGMRTFLTNFVKVSSLYSYSAQYISCDEPMSIYPFC